VILNRLEDLAELLQTERGELLEEWRNQVRRLPSAQQLPAPALIDHVPQLLNELIVAFRKSNDTHAEVQNDEIPVAHGVQRVADGFDISEVVAEYNILRNCILRLADDNALNLQGPPMLIINEVIDASIGVAVRSFAESQAGEVQLRREEHLTFIAHDLRTPLNAITLAVQLLDRQFPDQSIGVEPRRTLKSLRRNATYLSTLIAKVLDESAILTPQDRVTVHRREIDLWPMIESLIQDLAPLAQERKSILVNSVPEELIVFADAHLLRRVFQNLIANAITYTPGGTVMIGAREIEEGKNPQFQQSQRYMMDAVSGASKTGIDNSIGGLSRDGAASHDSLKIECWVSDTGTGIPEAYLEKIFEIGETVAETKEGTGLGLAIVKTFIEAHGGTIKVESKEGQGSIFHFLLSGKGSGLDEGD